MQEEYITGINEDGLCDLSLDMMNYADSIAELLDKIDNDFSSLKECYKGAPFGELLVKYEIFKKNFSVVKKNITSYADDYIALSNKMRNGSIVLSKQIIADSEEINSNIKKVEGRY